MLRDVILEKAVTKLSYCDDALFVVPLRSRVFAGSAQPQEPQCLASCSIGGPR